MLSLEYSTLSVYIYNQTYVGLQPHYPLRAYKLNAPYLLQTNPIQGLLRDLIRTGRLSHCIKAAGDDKTNKHIFYDTENPLRCVWSYIKNHVRGNVECNLTITKNLIRSFC